MRIMKGVFSSVAAACFLISAGNAEPNKVLYELQERCGKQAADTFQREVGGNIVNTKDGQMVANYETHYNAHLNKCFYLEMITTYPRAKDGKIGRSVRLFDLHANKEYANYFQMDNGPPQSCQVRDTFCRTEREWEALLKPFMEE
jgi:hypothetical protein